MNKVFSRSERLTRGRAPLSASAVTPDAPVVASGSNTNQGLTLMECIVAIAVIALTSAMIGPPLVLAAATRLQNQRAEQAMQIAQGEIDQIRALVSRSEHARARLPLATAATTLDAQTAPASSFGQIDSVNSSCPSLYTGAQVPITQALPVDMDGDCDPDFLVQFFRNAGEFSDVEDGRGTDGRPNRFEMMVRVYAANASQNYGSLTTDPASLQFTSGEGNQRERPLAVVTSEMSWSETDGALFCYHSADGDCSD